MTMPNDFLEWLDTFDAGGVVFFSASSSATLRESVCMSECSPVTTSV